MQRGIIKKSPVVVFGYNRPEHLRNCLESLNKCKFAEETEMYIYIDGHKCEKDFDNVNECKRVAQDFSKCNQYKKCVVIEQENNRGLANSVILGVSKVIDEYEKVIVVEDDLIVNEFFLKYMNEALEYYEKSDKIWSIAGFTYNLVALKKYKYDVYFTRRGCSWGWATWKNRWEMVDWSCQLYNTVLYRIFYKWKFTIGGCDLPGMLKLQMNGKIDSWAVRWCFNEMIKGMLTVYPRHSLVDNAGFDGSGVHCGESDENIGLIDEKFGKQVSFCIPFEKHKISEEFRKQEGYSYVAYIKRKLHNIVGMLLLRKK